MPVMKRPWFTGFWKSKIMHQSMLHPRVAKMGSHGILTDNKLCQNPHYILQGSCPLLFQNSMSKFPRVNRVISESPGVELQKCCSSESLELPAPNRGHNIDCQCAKNKTWWDSGCRFLPASDTYWLCILVDLSCLSGSLLTNTYYCSCVMELYTCN